MLHGGAGVAVPLHAVVDDEGNGWEGRFGEGVRWRRGDAEDGHLFLLSWGLGGEVGGGGSGRGAGRWVVNEGRGAEQIQCNSTQRN